MSLIALARADPGKYTFASSGYGSPLHLAGDIRRIVGDPAFVKTMLEMGAVMTADMPAEFAAFIADDYARRQKVIREAAIKVE